MTNATIGVGTGGFLAFVAPSLATAGGRQLTDRAANSALGTAYLDVVTGVPAAIWASNAVSVVREW